MSIICAFFYVKISTRVYEEKYFIRSDQMELLETAWNEKQGYPCYLR